MLILLTSRQFFAADLWTFSLTNGGLLRYCAGDQDITANGKLYSAGGLVGPYFDRQDNKAKVHWKVGTETDSLIVDVLPGSALVEGDAFLDAVRMGFFDGAECLLERAYMPSYGDTRCGTIRIFLGRVAEIDAGASIATFSINSHLELLNLQLPRNVAQIPCMNNLGDATCTVDLDSFKATGTVGVVTDRSNFACTLSGSFADGTFDGGKIVFTSGDLDGITGSVKALSSLGPSVAMLGPLPIPPSSGDTFTIYYGCNKSLGDTNGCPKFSNTAHFRGFPYIPQPVTAV